MDYSADAFEELTSLVREATKQAALELFATGESFYFLVLSTTGEALPPYLSAWSHEALARQAAARQWSPRELADARWASFDSPYFEFGAHFFRRVHKAFSKRDAHLVESDFARETDFRIDAMTRALRGLDEAGVFALHQPRDQIMINVEVLPPDHTNTTRARALNPPDAIRGWLEEAAEPEDWLGG